jgi:branched-chain amino acid transport system ATP-binding protein
MPISGSNTAVLNVTDLEVRYGKIIAASGISLCVNAGEIVVLLGPNGAGKTSIMRAIAGFVRPSQGIVQFFDNGKLYRLEGKPTFHLARLGIAHVPAQNIVLPRMTVAENLEMGARFLLSERAAVTPAVEAMLERFPVLHKRRHQFAGTLSGGEQRQLAIARGLISRPRLMLLDEPSIGLSPVILREIFKLLKRLNEEDGIAILMVEQNVVKALEVAHRAYVMRVGGMDFSGTSREVASSDRLVDAYLNG